MLIRLVAARVAFAVELGVSCVSMGGRGVMTTVEQRVEVRGITRAKAPEPALTDTAIRGERYWSPEFLRLEQDALWPRVWQVAGRVDQVPTPGDYIT